MRCNACADAPHRAERPRGMLEATIVAARLHLAVWRDRARYRGALARMSERELADIGVSWSQIAEEASKPFWRA